MLNSNCDALCEQRACARGRVALLLPALATPFYAFASQASAGAPAGKPPSVWVKRVDMPNAKYSLLKGVDLQETVDELAARWLAKAKLDVDPSLVTLRLVPCGVRTPSPAEELDAKVLAEPRLTLAAAGVFDRCSLLVDTESIAVDKKAISSEALCDLWKMLGYTVLLPSGDGLTWTSSCHFTVA